MSRLLDPKISHCSLKGLTEAQMKKMLRSLKSRKFKCATYAVEVTELDDGKFDILVEYIV